MKQTRVSKNRKKKVLVALSGGIDSAVSAYLLIKHGYEVEAAFMKNWSSTAGLKYSDCPWLQDRQDALRVAAFLRIPLHSIDFEKQYRQRVMNYFFEEYKHGRTPNPDVMCNKEIKFKLLYDWAMKRGFDYLATGHYARVGASQPARGKRRKLKPSLPHDSGSALLRSQDEFKDQTYFIYNIKPEQLPHILFPIGGMKKTAVRSLARKIKLPNAEKRESMGLCFVGHIRLKQFLEQKLKPKPGPIIGPGGEILGQHQGLYAYTIGQRQGVKIGATGPYYVFKKDLAANSLHVTNNASDPRLMTKEVQLHSVNWISDPWDRAQKAGSQKQSINKSAGKAVNLRGRYRHQGELVPLSLSQIDKQHYRVVFQRPQKAIASGQSLVIYRDKVCLGGGVIA